MKVTKSIPKDVDWTGSVVVHKAWERGIQNQVISGISQWDVYMILTRLKVMFSKISAKCNNLSTILTCTTQKEFLLSKFLYLKLSHNISRTMYTVMCICAMLTTVLPKTY